MNGSASPWGTMGPMAGPLWTPGAERVEGTRVVEFTDHLRAAGLADLDGFDDLHRWSVDRAG